MGTIERKSSATRREEIAKATLSIIGNRGLTKLTTARLAKEVGLTSGALFRHFESREEILNGAVEYGLSQIEETFPDEDLPPVERVLGLARSRVRLLSRERGLAFLLRSDQAFLSLPVEAVARIRLMVQRTRSFLLRSLREGVDEGSLRSDIEPEVLMVPVLGSIHALIGSAGKRRHEEQADLERVLEALRLLLSRPGNRNETENDEGAHEYDDSK